MFFETLNLSHVGKLLDFELENRGFFETVITPRKNDFYSQSGISKHIEDLLELNCKSLAFPFVLIENQAVIARANIKEVHPNGIGEIGYRVSKHIVGKGVGSMCVNHLVNTGINLGLNQLLAIVINNNPASEKVLLKNGFRLDLCFPNGFTHQGKPFHGFKYLRTLA